MHRVQLLRFAKFAGVLLFVGGAVAALLADTPTSRRIAVHRVGSLGLLLMWSAGYLLASTLGWSMGEPWIAGALASTLAIHLVLTWTVERDATQRRGVVTAVAALVLATLALMIWKPTWAGLS